MSRLEEQQQKALARKKTTTARPGTSSELSGTRKASSSAGHDLRLVYSPDTVAASGPMATKSLHQDVPPQTLAGAAHGMPATPLHLPTGRNGMLAQVRNAGRPSVALLTSDPLVEEGAAAFMESSEHVTLLSTDQAAQADIVVLITTIVTGEALSELNRLSQRPGGSARIVLVADDLSPSQLTLAIGYGMVSFLQRSAVNLGQIVTAVVDSHRGRPHLPPPAVNGLIDQLNALQRAAGDSHHIPPANLALRELDVLRLLSQGLDTSEIASALSYSERSIKSIIHDVVKRLGLRNRTHAVVHAIRAGLL